MSYRQLSFFDLDLLEREPDVLLKEGQTVYKVIRGDVEELIYIGGTWLCNEGKERGYRLKGYQDTTIVLGIRKLVLLFFLTERKRKQLQRHTLTAMM